MRFSFDSDGNDNNDDDEEDDDDNVTFFPIKNKSNKKLDLSDTFSIQEMTIESDSDGDSESQNLEFLMPKSAKLNLIESIQKIFCCTNK